MRPCPWVSCRYHLLLDVTSDGRLRVNQMCDTRHGDSIANALERMPETCALDVADQGPQGQVTIGRLLRLSHQRIDQIETAALFRARLSGGLGDPGGEQT